VPCRLVNQQRFCSHPPTHTNERPTSAGRRTPFHFHACHSTQQAHATPPPRRLCRRGGGGGPAVPAYASAVKICVMAGLERGPGRQGPAAVTRQKAREMLAASSSRRIRDPEILRASMTTCVLRVFAPSIRWPNGPPGPSPARCGPTLYRHGVFSCRVVSDHRAELPAQARP
jgi:hypothetical protein